MNWNRIEGEWKQYKGRALQKWGKLTNDDLDVIDGKRSELIGRLQKRYSKNTDEIEREVDQWLESIS